jgi:hypothetical protein
MEKRTAADAALSKDSAVPAYITEINNVLINQRLSLLMAIPEPSAELLLCCLLAIGGVTTRRRE